MSLQSALPIPDDIAESFARAGTRLGCFQRRLLWYEEVSSTNDLAGILAQHGAAEGSIVAANGQTAGRGRLGRTWVSPLGAGLYVSVVLRPAVEAAPLITLAAGLAVADGICAATGLATRLKWPNDIYAGDRKLAGILAEAGSPGGRLQYVVVGFGINLLTTSYPLDVAGRATSIERELGRIPDRGLVLAECLASLAAYYGALQRDEREAIVSAWRARAAGLGRTVEWNGDDGVRRGIAHDIDSSGALLVRVGETIVRVISGEVRWLS